MKESYKLKWERKRAKGKRRYIIYNGILGWGIPTAVIFTIVTSIMDNESTILDGEFVKSLIITLITFSIGGLFFGLWSWHTLEKQYRNMKN